jgi:hypothetical protein
MELWLALEIADLSRPEGVPCPQNAASGDEPDRVKSPELDSSASESTLR